MGCSCTSSGLLGTDDDPFSSPHVCLFRGPIGRLRGASIQPHGGLFRGPIARLRGASIHCGSTHDLCGGACILGGPGSNDICSTPCLLGSSGDDLCGGACIFGGPCNNDTCGTCLLGSSDDDYCGVACIFGGPNLRGIRYDVSPSDHRTWRIRCDVSTNLRGIHCDVSSACLFCSPSDHRTWRRIRYDACDVWTIFFLCLDDLVRLASALADAMAYVFATVISLLFWRLLAKGIL